MDELENVLEVALWDLVLCGGVSIKVVVMAGTSDAARFRISNVAEAKTFVAALTVGLEAWDGQLRTSLL